MSLSFTLLPDALVQFHALLICFAKFNESIRLEASRNGLRLSTLNSTNSAHVSAKINRHPFFSQYSCTSSSSSRQGTQSLRGGDAILVTCQVYIKALLSVFKGRVNDTRDKDNVVERCEVKLLDGANRDGSRCRLVIRMFCKHGVVKTYKLTYEAVEVQHAIFDPKKVENRWCLDAHVLREVIEHFGSNAEQLDIYCKNDRAVFTSFTTKVIDGNEVLRQPVHTSVAIDTHDFDYLSIQPNLHAAVSARDFKAIVAHANSCKVPVFCEFSQPCKPMRLSYDLDEGSVLCEFTLMTRDASGDASAEAGGGQQQQRAADDSTVEPEDSRIEVDRSTSAKTSPQERFLWRQQHGSKPLSPTLQPAERPMPGSAAAPTYVPGATPSMMPPPLPRDHLDQAQPRASLLEDESLFVPVDNDDDHQWDEPDYEEEHEDILRWDINAAHRIHEDIVGRTSATDDHNHNQNNDDNDNDNSNDDDDNERDHGSIKIPPTQRISQIHGLFD